MTASIWSDPDPLDASWRRPSRLSLVPRWVKVLTPVVALALLIAGTLVAGGFKKGETTVTRAAAGTPIRTGPLVITPHQAEWRWASWSNSYKATVLSTCELVDDKAPALQTFSVAHAVYAATINRRDISQETLVNIGSLRVSGVISKDSLTPAAGPEPCYLDFTFDSTEPPASLLLLSIADLVYQDQNLSQSGGDGWKVGNHATLVQVPAVIRTPQTKDS